MSSSVVIDSQCSPAISSSGEGNSGQEPSTCAVLQPADNVDILVSNLEPDQLLSEDDESLMGKDFRDDEDELVYRILSVYK